MEIVKAVLDTIVAIGVLIAFGFGVKYWIDKGMDKFLNSQVGESERINARLRRELKAQKKIQSELCNVLEQKQLEIECLAERVEELEHQKEILNHAIDNMDGD